MCDAEAKKVIIWLENGESAAAEEFTFNDKAGNVLKNMFGGLRRVDESPTGELIRTAETVFQWEDLQGGGTYIPIGMNRITGMLDSLEGKLQLLLSLQSCKGCLPAYLLAFV